VRFTEEMTRQLPSFQPVGVGSKESCNKHSKAIIERDRRRKKNSSSALMEMPILE
jgi:hypothetical protein